MLKIIVCTFYNRSFLKGFRFALKTTLINKIVAPDGLLSIKVQSAALHTN